MVNLGTKCKVVHKNQPAMRHITPKTYSTVSVQLHSLQTESNAQQYHHTANYDITFSNAVSYNIVL